MSRTSVTQRYRGASRVDDALRLVSDADRAPVRVRADLDDPVPVREALSVLYEIVQSDLRYKPKDRSAYLAFQRMRRGGGSAQTAAGQQAYYRWLAANDPLAWFVLDPVVTVNPDAVLFEVFSKDEGTWAQLSIDREVLDVDGDWVCGTTNIDFSEALYDGIQRIRSYRPVSLAIGPDAVEVAAGDDAVVEKKIELPDAWLRGFLQVQSSATLARAVVSLSPVALYNVFRELRLNADQKRKGRAIRVELVPGETPRLVLEPWETVIETAEPYTGDRPEVVRIWGRRRWMLARRLLPFVTEAKLHLLGSGLPSFLVLRGEGIALTLGLTGFTSANWSRSVQFDTLLPRPGDADDLQEALLKTLSNRWVASRADLAEATGAEPTQVLAALQAAGQNGHVAFDLARDVVRLRPVVGTPLDPARLAFRNDTEKQAHDLVGAVKIATEEVVHGQGTRLVAKVKVEADKREYRPGFLLDDEGRVRKAECTCNAFLARGLKEGPCAHLLALRLKWADLLAKRAARRGTAVTTETRTYTRREPEGEAITQLSIDKTRLKVRWGRRADDRLRVLSLVFDSVDDARTDYFDRIARLEASGFLDASAS